MFGSWGWTKIVTFCCRVRIPHPLSRQIQKPMIRNYHVYSIKDLHSTTSLGMVMVMVMGSMMVTEKVERNDDGNGNWDGDGDG